MISLCTRFSHGWSGIDTRIAHLQADCLEEIKKILARLGSFSIWREMPDPREDFTSVLKDARQWRKLGNIETQVELGVRNPNFLFGTATCTYQDSGSAHCPNSQWASWEKKIIPENNRSGKSANFFELYKTQRGREQITDKLRELGVNSYRFSVDWSQIEPEEGKWDEENLEVYIDLCQHLRDHGIIPMATLHHFSEPLWFHKKGSFEKEQNIQYFLKFSDKAFSKLTESYNGDPLVEYFCTINEPAIDTLSRFVRGVFSPGLFFNFTRAAHFLKGALKAHSLVYQLLKKKAPDSVKIGAVHQYLKFVSTNPLLSPITYYLTRLVNDVALHYFSTGKFEFKMPFVHVTDDTMPKPQTDFVALQYYVRSVIGMLGPTGYNAPMTQMPYCEDPEGLYEAIIETHKAFEAPVIVTENGISTHDEEQRERYLVRALYAAQRAVEKIGSENFLGYYLWSFSDNFEWDMGMKPQAFGAFSLDGTMKKGAKVYSRILGHWRETWQEEQRYIKGTV